MNGPPQPSGEANRAWTLPMEAHRTIVDRLSQRYVNEGRTDEEAMRLATYQVTEMLEVL